MAPPPIRFDDGVAYERGMARWSQHAGRTFLEWMAPEPGLHWLDVGCGNGAFTELILETTSPAQVHGIDPSNGQIDYAQSRPGAKQAQFQIGDALALPFPDDSFDVAIMALVIFFVPDPPRGVSEMIRVVRPGGRIAAYAWDIPGGGFPMEILLDELRADGITPPLPPHAEVARADALRALWRQSGLEAIEQRPITVERTFADFDEFWASSTASGSIVAVLGSRSPEQLEDFKRRVQARLPPPDPDGRITTSARANAIIGRKHQLE
jgi:ubiquinone/menaquinone biosynthesis C-methylase UbiE